METRIRGQGQLFYGLDSGDLRVSSGKRTLEWDPNDWKWDGDLFIASPLNLNPNPIPNPLTFQSRQFFPLETGISTTRTSSNSSSSCSEEENLEAQKDKHGELEKRRRIIIVDNENRLEDESATLSLKLGRRGYPTTDGELGNWEGTSGKKTKLTASTSNRAVCQVEDCGADLSKAKDYHRRHKVCEMHSKASKALVGNVMQRFCQQCSRFHALQEFDEGKRSCRRRLAGHNKRRRKTQPDAVANNSSLNDSQASGYLLMTLLKILSNMHSNQANHQDNQDLLSHLLRSLASQGALHGDKNLSDILQESPNLINGSIGNSEIASTLLSNGSQGPARPKQLHCTTPSVEMPQKASNLRVENEGITSSQTPGILFPIQSSSPPYTHGRESSAGRSKLNNFDLNDVYIDSDDGLEEIERSPPAADLGTGSLECRSWLQQESHQSSLPQTSGNSDSGSAQSPSSSSGDAQSRTDRIVFKLFGKEPSDFPFLLRAQILDWLSHSPSDMESYIRPGCIFFTIYIRQSESAWEELCCDLSSSLSRLLDVPGNTFWKSGWIYIRVQNQLAFVCNGQVVVDTFLPFKTNDNSAILSVKPIAAPVSERVQFTVKGFNLSRPSTRLLCALEGNYLVTDASGESAEPGESVKEHDRLQFRSFSCNVPPVTGRGFIEVEDIGVSSSFFPFIVAEKDICSEIRMLESDIELSEIDYIQGETKKMEARNQAMEFIHEIGWLLHRFQLRTRLGHLDPNADLFPFKRFKWLVEFSVDHDWCAVVKKLLDILLSGTVGAVELPFLKCALFEINLLHRAVRRNSRPLVELLLRYAPEKVAEELNLEFKSLVGGEGSFLFRPDLVGPAGLTPLHVAAGRDGSEDVLDALTDDPGEVAIEAWKNARDSTGFTPEDYARLRGHYSYIHLVQRKINRKLVAGHVVVDIPSALVDGSRVYKQNEPAATSFEIARTEKRSHQWPCRQCHQKLSYGNSSRHLLYRPAMLSMVAVAAVCVCVALLFKSSPEVLFIFQPFRWEMLDYGSS